MKSRLLRTARPVLWLILVFWSLTGHVLTSESSQVSLVDYIEQDFKGLYPPLSHPGRSILSFSPKRSTNLVAAPDGTIYLVEIGSMRVIWSFPTGSPTYRSYQAPLNKDNVKENVSGLACEFIECGDDWALYIQSKHFGKVRLSTSIADFVAATPTFSDDGAVTLGSKRSTLFEVDAITGKVIRSYAADNISALWSNDTHSVTNIVSTNIMELADPTMPSAPELLLKIIRTDYSLQGVGPGSENVLWTMNVAEFKASLFCGHNENLYAGASLDSEDKYVSNSDLDFSMPYACHDLKEVYRLRKNFLLGDLTESLPRAHHANKMLPVPSSDVILPSQSNLDISSTQHDDNMMLPTSFPNLLPSSHQNLDSYDNNDNAAALSQPSIRTTAPEKVGRNRVIEWPRKLLLIPFLLGLLICHYFLKVKKQAMLEVQNSGSEIKITTLKKKRARKSRKNNGIGDKRNKHLSSEDEDVITNGKPESEALPLVEKIEGADGRQIGKVFVSNKEIAKGSNGTVIFEGIYEGRPVAVKRLIQAHHDIAFKEIQNLIASDHHLNIVRWHGVESDQDFIYLALERCTCNLDDLIQICSDFSSNSVFSKDQPSRCLMKVQIDMGKDNMQELWKANGSPSPLLLKLMRDIVSGLVHLHELGIIHRDLKPQNILIIKERYLGAKLSDMGISKRLSGDVSSFSHNATGCGSSGWQAPEQLLQGRQTRAVDLFSLGCVLFFCITKGKHPFGERLERDINIAKNQKNLFLVEFIPEAEDLISCLLNPKPDLRPKAIEVLHHPFFWNSEMRLSFLRDTSDRVELEDRETGSTLLNALESIAPTASGAKWNEKMESAFITDIGRYRRYRFDSVRDLLRLMRNKLNHYRELPQEIQELVGPIPEGFNGYFASRFPRLLIEVYKIVYKYCKQEECFQRYFKDVN